MSESEEEKKLIEKEEKRLKEEAEKERLKEEEEYKKQTDYERKKYFKGTIVVIVIYGLAILAISIAGIVSPMMRELLFVSGFPFTTTFISGVVLVIIFLLAQIFTYKPAEMPEKYSGDNLSCPDYWELKKTPVEELLKISDKKQRHLSKYYCQNPNDTTNTNVPTSSNTSTREYIKLIEVVNKYNNNEPSIDQNYHMKCNRLYPDYMATIDKQNFPLNPTKLRCEYINQCGAVTWTNVCSK
jgi:hypothetical protein